MEETMNSMQNENIQSTQEKTLPPVQKASLVKRVIAGIVDIFVFVFFWILLQSFVVTPIAKSCAKDYDVRQQEVINYFVESGLATFDEKKGQLMQIEKEKYIEVSQKYFNEYCASGDEGKACSSNKKTFKELIEEDETLSKDNKYYEFDEHGNFSVKRGENESEDDYNAKKEKVEQYIYSKAINFLSASEVYKKSYSYISTVQTIVLLISIVISLTIVYLLPPLISKKSQTIGQMVFGLGIVNSKGYKVKKSQIVVRFIAFSFINIGLGLVTYMIVPLVSFTIMVFSKNNSALHDYCSATMVIDDKTSFIYDNEDDYLAAKQKEKDTIENMELRRNQYYEDNKIDEKKDEN